MKTVFTKIFSIIPIIVLSHVCQAEQTTETEIVEVFVDYVSEQEAYSIDWPASMAATGKFLRKASQNEGKVFLAFVVRGHLDKMGPRPPAITHHEAINARIGDADFEFVWLAPMVLPDQQTETLVFVRPRNHAP